jgi:hypothetical protein
VGRLVDERIDRHLLKLAMIRSAINPVLHSIAVLVAFVDTRLSIALYIILPLMFFVPSKLERYGHPKIDGRAIPVAERQQDDV